MKLLIYSKVFLPTTGGVQTIVSELARGLAERNCANASGKIEVTVVTDTQGKADEDSFPFALVRKPTFGTLVRLIRQADVVHVAGPAMLPLALAHFFRKPVTVEHHGYQSICPNGILVFEPDRSLCPGHFMAERYEMCLKCNAGNLGLWKSFRSMVLTFPRRWLCQKANRNIAVTNHVLKRIALPRTEVIYHGITDQIGPLTGHAAARDGALVQVAYIGRLVSEKGLPVLLRAAKFLDDEGLRFNLVFIGDGRERSNLENLARNLQFRNRVDFQGELRGDRFAEAMRSVDVVVMPSLWEETAGLAAIEQMTRGGVVVATDIGGLGEIVGDAGLRFPPGDANALYLCLRKLIEDPRLRATLGAAARVRARKEFNLDGMLEKHVSLYCAILRSE